MDRVTFLYFVSAIYPILSLWGYVQAALLRLQWYYLVALLVLLIYLPPVGFGMTMFCKYIIWSKKRRDKKKANPDPDSRRDGIVITYE